jgi:Tfp pilus assembly protein PilV
MAEVMMGLAILAIGAAAVIALLKFTLLGTLDSRHVANASMVTASYIERIQTAALAWNAFDNQDLADMDGLGPPDSPVPNFGALVNGVAGGLAAGTPSAWSHFGAPSAAANPAFARATLDGALTAGPNDTAYCTHVRVTFTSGPDLPAAGILAGDNFRVELRTFWARSGRTVEDECQLAPASMDAMFDSPAATLAVGPATRTRAEYGVVYLSTIVRRNTQ